MSIQPRPALKYGLEVGITEPVTRIETYRTLNPRWKFWRSRYNVHQLALTNKAIYHLCASKCGEKVLSEA